MLLVLGGESVDHAPDGVLWDKTGCIVTHGRAMHGGGGALYKQVLYVGRGGDIGVQAGGAGEWRGLLETVMRWGRRVRVLSTQGGRATGWFLGWGDSGLEKRKPENEPHILYDT